MSKYIYIMGRGHSGSTVLDCLLDNAEGIQGVGETVVGLGRDFQSVGEGERDERVARFWSQVKEVFQARGQEEKWENAIDLYTDQAHPSRFLRTLFSNESNVYIRKTLESIEEIYESVLSVSGERTIVDSSKEVTRALLMAKHLGNCFLIHLVRNPLSVLSSDLDRIVNNQKFRFMRNSYNTEGFEYLFAALTCINWCLGNVLCEVVKMHHKTNTITIRYEDLKKNPRTSLSKLGAKIGVDLEEVIRKIESEIPMSTGIGLSGNRMRRGRDDFVFDVGPPKTHDEIPMRYKIVCKMINFPLMIRYGYA